MRILVAAELIVLSVLGSHTLPNPLHPSRLRKLAPSGEGAYKVYESCSSLAFQDLFNGPLGVFGDQRFRVHQGFFK